MKIINKIKDYDYEHMNNNNSGFDHIKELDAYLKDIENIKPLTLEEELELGRKIQDGDDDAVNKLVYHNLKFVVMVAKQYRDRGVPFNDLISEGNLGMFHAARKYDPERKYKFTSYAIWWIKNSINECIDTYRRNTENTVSNDYVFDKSKDEIDYRYDMINEEFEEQLENIQNRRDAVDVLMRCLKEREKKILMMFYGLGGKKEMTLDEVGKEMNLTNERVRQIKDGAISKLKCEVLSFSDEEFNILKNLS